MLDYVGVLSARICKVDLGISFLDWAQGLDHIRSKTQVRDKMTVHDIEMQPFRIGPRDPFSFSLKETKISSQKGWSDNDLGFRCRRTPHGV